MTLRRKQETFSASNRSMACTQFSTCKTYAQCTARVERILTNVATDEEMREEEEKEEM